MDPLEDHLIGRLGLAGLFRVLLAEAMLGRVASSSGPEHEGKVVVVIEPEAVIEWVQLLMRDRQRGV